MVLTDKTAFTQIGGARIGSSYWWAINATWPFATIIVSPDNLMVKFLGKSYRFNKSDIEKLAVYSGLFSKGLQVQHAVAGYPKFVVFWTNKLENLLANLERQGFRIG